VKCRCWWRTTTELLLAGYWFDAALPVGLAVNGLLENRGDGLVEVSA
jgi:hypothetical protein